MEADSFIFCENSLTSLSFSAFQDMKKTGELVDFKVTIQNRSFVAHRIVLAAGIPYLRAMFASSVSEISLPGIDPNVFEDVIDFAYYGKIKISVLNVRSLLEASQLLQLTTVHDACVKYIAMRINVNNAFAVREFAGNIQSLRLALTCDQCILRNFEAFLFSHLNEFLQLPFPYLKEIISRDDLNVTSEERVFEAVMLWIKAWPAERFAFLPELLRVVRMARIKPEYLVDKVASEELVMSSMECKSLIDETKNYHLLPKARASLTALMNVFPRNTSGHGLYAICSSELGNFIDMFDTDKEMWMTLSHVGRKEFDHVVGFNSKIYIFSNFQNKFETIDTITLKRESMNISEGSCNPEGSFRQIVLHECKFYAFTSLKVLCFDPTLKKWEGTKVFIDSEDAGISSLGQYIYVTGGYIGCSSSKVSKRYHPSTSSKSEISSMLVERRCHGCTGLNNKLYVCGGLFCKQAETAEVYDPLTNEWRFISPVKLKVSTISLHAYKGKVYALGEDEMKIYDPEHAIWKCGPPVPHSCKFAKYVTIRF